MILAKFWNSWSKLWIITLSITGVCVNSFFVSSSNLGFSTGVCPIKPGTQAVLDQELCWMETVYCITAECCSYCFSISRKSWPDKFYDYTKCWQVTIYMSLSLEWETLHVSEASLMGLIYNSLVSGCIIVLVATHLNYMGLCIL